MSFKDIIGQENIKQRILKGIKENSLAHAYIFTGPKGIGKRLMATNLAQALLCSDANNAPCNSCTACKLTYAGTNPDLTVIEADGSSISVEEIRKIQSSSNIRPLYSNNKVYIIVDGDKMTVQAQNSLLKTFEEPPEYCKIIITTSNVEKLLETIRSRAIKMSFIKYTQNEIEEILLKNSVLTNNNMDFIYAYSEGIPGKAIELCTSETFLDLKNTTLEYVNNLKKDKINGLFKFSEYLIQNKDSIDTILDLLIIFYRDLFISKKNLNNSYLINSDKKGMILEYSQKLSCDNIINSIEVIESARKQIKQNANLELVLDVMLMELVKE